MEPLDAWAINPCQILAEGWPPGVRSGQVRRLPARLRPWQYRVECRANSPAIRCTVPEVLSVWRRRPAIVWPGCGDRRDGAGEGQACRLRARHDNELGAQRRSSACRRSTCGAWFHSKALRHETPRGQMWCASSLSRAFRRSGAALSSLALPEPVALAVHFENVDVMGQPVEQRAGQSFRREHAGPFIERQIACKRRRKNPSLKRPDCPVAPE